VTNVESLSREELIAVVTQHKQTIAQREQTIAQREQTIAQHVVRISELEVQLKWFRNQIFGRKSERRLAGEARFVQLGLGDLLEEEKTPPPTETVKEYQRRIKPLDPTESGDNESKLRFSEDVPVKVIPLAPEGIEGLTEGKDFQVIDEKVTYRLAQRPASYVVLKYVRPVVKLHDKVLSVPAPAGVLDRSFADVSLVAGILVDKFQYHLPLYRQHQRLTAAGIMMSRQTLTNFVAQAAELLTPVYYAQLSSILQSEVLAMDETPIKAGRAEKGKLHQGYFWPLYGDKDEVAFPYGATRSLTQAQEILGEFAGTLVTDGYGVYARYSSRVSGVTHATCWAHTRRKFIEAEESESSRSKKALEYIRLLYEIEESIRDHESDKILCVRRERSLPIIEDFFKWLKHELADLTLLPSSPFCKAASYALERRVSLTVYASDPAVPIDTNHLERALRAIPMGRKNWLFCWTEVGAEYVGKIQSLLVTCRLHGIDPYAYFVDVLQRISITKAHDVADLTPLRWKELFAHNPLGSDLDMQ
jgi:transposase